MMGRRRLIPWLWIAPVLIVVATFLIYPVVWTTAISFLNANSSEFIGVENFKFIFTQRETLIVLRNNLYWVALFTAITVMLGLILAVLMDRVSYESIAKAVIFVPMAISFVAAGVIWTFMYRFQPDAPGFTQTGTINAALTALGASPVAWLVNPTVNNFAIILAGIWMWTGLALVILSAGLKGISTEILEAARVDGASEWHIFWRIIVPLLWPTILVVVVTLMINALKVFDLVFIMTGGRFETDVIATRMWREMFISLNFGKASALAVVLFLIIVPVMILNVRRFKREEE
jgi:alpha-glucoside transport system permease protein